MEGALVGGCEYPELDMSGMIVGIAGIASMGGMGKKPLNGGLELNDSGCV
jgi:hypothetical protein